MRHIATRSLTRDTTFAFCCMIVFVLSLRPLLAAAEPTDPARQSNRPTTPCPHIPRTTPSTLPDHPGNVFLLGQTVTIQLPAKLIKTQRTIHWRLLDENRTLLRSGTFARNLPQQTLVLGKLATGWYRLELLDAEDKPLYVTTAAVIHPLAQPVPQDSPICVDSATAWFAPANLPKQRRFAYLAALAGVNWIRDRLSWGHIQPAPQRFATNTTYDSSATVQAQFGLKVLQVFHDIPGWAARSDLDGPNPKTRFPRDLRILYNFCKRMALRFKGRVLAWEPWNEANIPPFGGHTIDQMCTHQKAAYLAFKAADPNLIVCWNVYAGAGTALHTQGVLENHVWPYFDTYNIHSYRPPEQYPQQFAPARQAACGRPIWITECGIGLHWTDPGSGHELSASDELKQAKFIARSYATSLFAGVSRHFFFILGNYPEGSIQFGLLRADQTPRPGYVALAAVGRLLAGARCLGRLIPSDQPHLRIYAFRAVPDGKAADVLVVWAQQSARWQLPSNLPVRQVYDYLGRPVGKQLPQPLDSAACFVLLEKNAATELPLEPPLTSGPRRSGKPSPLVLQVSLPAETIDLSHQTYRLDTNTPLELPLFAYNFSSQPIHTTIHLEKAPPGWSLQLQTQQLTIPPMQSKPLSLHLTIPSSGRAAAFGDWIKLRATSNTVPDAFLAFRIASKLDQLEPSHRRPIRNATDPAAWQDNIVEGATMSHRRLDDHSLLFEMHFGQTDPWAYPTLQLDPNDVPDPTIDGLELTIQLLQGSGDVRVQFKEQSTSRYITDAALRTARDKPRKVYAWFDTCRWGEWSPPDPDGKLQPQNIRSIMVGINASKNSTVKLIIKDLAWVRF